MARDDDRLNCPLPTFWNADLLLPALLATVLGADLRAGVEAFERGDYAAAMRKWRPLVELGLAECQRHVELSGFRHVKRFQPG